jgi:ribonuclease P protein component
MATFSADERIKSKKLLEKLYQEGEQLTNYPYRLKFLKLKFEHGANVQIVISVPKRNVKKAVGRNRIKRQMKEAYRLNKADLLSQFKGKEKGLALFLIYTGKENQPYSLIESKLVGLLDKLQKAL